MENEAFPFECSLCSYAASLRKNMFTHMISMHLEEISAAKAKNGGSSQGD